MEILSSLKELFFWALNRSYLLTVCAGLTVLMLGAPSSKGSIFHRNFQRVILPKMARPLLKCKEKRTYSLFGRNRYDLTDG